MKKLVVVAAAVVLAVLRLHDAAACSCSAPEMHIIGPDRTSDTALNTHVRFEAPWGGPNSTSPTPVLRVSATGTSADISARQWVDGSQLVFDVTPVKSLAPETRYEIALVDPSPDRFPRTTVLGTFVTGQTMDTAPPKLDSVGAAVARGNPSSNGGDCAIRGPWIEIERVAASDPGRPNARLLIAIWGSDAKGNLDISKPPTRLKALAGGRFVVGKGSLCDPHDFPLPPTPTVTIALAAVDEAGNTSPIRKLPPITLTGIGTHP